MIVNNIDVSMSKWSKYIYFVFLKMYNKMKMKLPCHYLNNLLFVLVNTRVLHISIEWVGVFRNQEVSVKRLVVNVFKSI